MSEIVDRLPGTELIGRHYEGPVFALTDREPGGFPVIAGDFVTTEDGTGLVHIAPAFGEDDYRVAAENELFDPTDHGEPLQPGQARRHTSSGQRRSASRAASSRTPRSPAP